MVARARYDVTPGVCCTITLADNMNFLPHPPFRSLFSEGIKGVLRGWVLKQSLLRWSTVSEAWREAVRGRWLRHQRSSTRRVQQTWCIRRV